MLINYFSWAKFNYTLHEHSAELIDEIYKHGLGTVFVEPLEANNKDLRRYMENLSRKCNAEQTMS